MFLRKVFFLTSMVYLTATPIFCMKKGGRTSEYQETKQNLLFLTEIAQKGQLDLKESDLCQIVELIGIVRAVENDSNAFSFLKECVEAALGRAAGLRTIQQFNDLNLLYLQRKSKLTIEGLTRMSKRVLDLDVSNVPECSKEAQIMVQDIFLMIDAKLKGLKKQVEMLVEKRDETKDIKKFVMLVNGNTRVCNVMYQLKAVSQFGLFYSSLVSLVNMKPSFGTCPAMALRSAQLLLGCMNQVSTDEKCSPKKLNSVCNAVSFVKDMRWNKSLETNWLPAQEMRNMIRGNKVEGLCEQNTTIVESVGVFTAPSHCLDETARRSVARIKKRMKTVENGFCHAFIVGTGDNAYFSDDYSNVVLDSMHWFCVFVVKVEDTFYWFVADTGGANHMDDSDLNFLRLRYMIDHLLTGKSAVRYVQLYKEQLALTKKYLGKK